MYVRPSFSVSVTVTRPAWSSGSGMPSKISVLTSRSGASISRYSPRNATS